MALSTNAGNLSGPLIWTPIIPIINSRLRFSIPIINHPPSSNIGKGLLVMIKS
jgi:hypothetical protein